MPSSRLSSRAPWILALALALGAWGCAQGGGGGGTDSGPGIDAAPGLDSGGTDAGTTGADSGTDSGPGTDAGPRLDAGPVDSGPSGVDSGPTGTDSGPTGCTGAGECDDGLYCNGLERCELGRCVPGTPAVCDDSVACTRNRCLEPSSGTTPSCDYTPDDALCPSGQICGATGCTTTCTESPCRLVSPQCGCSSGQGCYLSGATRLCATRGTAGEGASCTGVAGCMPGLICINVSSGATAVNECHRFCDTDAHCVGTGSICAYTLNDGMGGTVPGARVCSRSCNPVTQSGCAPGASCNIFRESTGAMRFFFDCSAPIGTGGTGAFCTAASDCRAGYACVGTPGTCLRYCSSVGGFGTAAGCSSIETCYGFATPLLVGGTEYGVCDL